MISIQKIFLKIAIAAAVLFGGLNAQAKEVSVLVLSNQGIKQYDRAIENFKQELADKSFTVNYTLIDENDAEKGKMALLDALSAKPDLIFSVGTEKSLLAKNNVTDRPILFTMVLDPVEGGLVKSYSPSGSNITGVSLKINIQSQFEKLKQALPKVSKVGMLYDASTKTAMKDEAQAAANALGLELIAKPITSKSDVANALDDLMGEAQCLWAGVDTLVYNAQSSKYILLTTLRNKIPFMAFSSNYVNAGALMALEADYDDIGRQSADLAIKILNGQNPGSLPVETPRKVKMLTNQNTADVIGVAIPQELLE